MTEALNRFLTCLVVCLYTFLGHSEKSWATNFSYYNAIGFSESREVFVFEVVTKKEVSGVDYHELFFIHLPTDTWLKRLSASATSNTGKQHTNMYGPFSKGFSIAKNTIWQKPTHNRELSWGQLATGALPHTYGKTLRLILDDFYLAAPENYLAAHGRNSKEGYCKGFVLTLNQLEIHKDATVPSSRRCPEDYSLTEVLCSRSHGPENCVAIIRYDQPGFEGSDVDYLVQPLQN